MTPQPSSDQGFQIVPTAEPGYDAFRIMVPMSTVRPGAAVAAGTTFANAALPFKHRSADGWADYVAGRRETAEAGYLWQNFVRALPTTPTVADGDYHPIFGRTYIHTYDDLITNTRPDRGDSFTVTTDTSLTLIDGTTVVTLIDGTTPVTLMGTRIVLECTEQDQGQGLCEVKVTTVDNAQVTILDDEGADESSGLIDTVARTHTLSSTRPASVATDATGYYTLVTRQAHNWWVGTRRKASNLPDNEANALTESKIERTDVYWPDVLADYKFLAVLDASTLTYWHKKLFYTIKAAYTGDVQVDYTEWWQYDEPTLPDPVEMVATPISIPREWSDNINIDRCLHSLFEVGEPIIGGSVPYSGDTAYKQATYSVPATPYTDWPDEVVKLDVKRELGGYHCIKRRIKKPSTTIAGTQLTMTPYVDTVYYYSNYDTDGGG